MVYVETPAGQLSWHVAAADVELFPPLPRAPRCPWDGHGTGEKYARLALLAAAERAGAGGWRRWLPGRVRRRAAR